MKKIYLFSLLLAIVAGACTKDENPDPDGLSPELRKVADLIASAGELQTAEEKNVVKTVKTDTLPGTIPSYSDPYSGISYPAVCVEKTTHYDMVDNPMEFVTLDPWPNIWPGALVQGASLSKGVPALISIYEKRKPGRIYLSLVSGAEDMDEWYKEVPMRGSDVIQAQNELMADFLGNSIPARTSFEIKTVHSVEEMAMKLGINLKLFGAKLNTEFGKDWNQTKSYVAVKLNQLFFTMAYEAPDGGFQGVFTDNIRAWELADYTGFGNPICYVGSVSYGRTFVLLYESSYSSQELETAISSGFRKYMSNTVSERQKKVLNESTCKMVQIGGNPEEGLETVFGNFAALEKFLQNATVSKNNVGAPISYAIYYLKDNTFARLSNTLSYDVTTKTYYPVQAMNNVVIDVLSLDVSRPTPRQRKYKVSNYSSVKIKSIDLVSQKVDGSGSQSYRLCEVPFELERRGNKNGTNITLSGTQLISEVAKNKRLTLDCRVEVHNQIYHGGTKKETREVRLMRTFECTPEGQWRAVEDANSTVEDSFSSIKRTETIADADIDLDLKIRFVQDGIVLE